MAGFGKCEPRACRSSYNIEPCGVFIRLHVQNKEYKHV